MFRHLDPLPAAQIFGLGQIGDCAVSLQAGQSEPPARVDEPVASAVLVIGAVGRYATDPQKA